MISLKSFLHKTLPTVLISLLVALFAGSSGHAGEDPIYTSLFSNKAIGGYDPTTFFDGGQPQLGDARHKTEYKGAAWHFVNEENLAKFSASPDEYMPQFGGYCAWAVANGGLQKGSPEHWDVYDGKLYLSFNAKIQKTWREDRDAFINRANAQWPALLEE